MNICLHEFRAYRKFTIIWTIALVGIMMLYLSVYPVIEKDAESYIKILEGYPQEVRAALGLHLENFASLLGYYSFTFTMVSLFAAVQAMIIGTGIVSKEAREKTADFLLTKPVSRSRILTGKLLAAFSIIIFTNIVYLISAVIMANLVKNSGFEFGTFLMIAITMLFVQIIFLSIGIMLSIVLPKIKSVLTISLAVVFGFFSISAFSAASGDNLMRYLTPLKYFDTAYIMENGKYELPFAVVSALLVIAAIALSYFIYAKKDIHAV